MFNVIHHILNLGMGWMIYTPVNIAGWKMDLLKYIVPIIKAMLVDQRVPSRS